MHVTKHMHGLLRMYAHMCNIPIYCTCLEVYPRHDSAQRSRVAFIHPYVSCGTGLTEFNPYVSFLLLLTKRFAGKMACKVPS